MSAPLRLWRNLLAVAFATLALRATPSHGSELLAPAAGERVRAGLRVTASWARTDDVASADEVELILSLDGGRSFPIRVTTDLPPEIQEFAFLVPQLPSRQARLALRAGHEGTESIIAIGAEFVIEEATTPALEPLVPVRGEWRTRDALEATSRTFEGSSLGKLRTQVSALTASFELGLPQASDFFEFPLSPSPEPYEQVKEQPARAPPSIRRHLSLPKRE